MVDYSVYLVTDSTMVPPASTFIKQVEDSVANGATIVQLREKSILTLDFIERAKQVHALTRAKGIPLIINDRVDVALAVDAEGVHVGQDDMPARLVRQLIGPDKILGVTCSNPEEVAEVCKEGIADYVGLGTVYATNTKKNVTNPEGTGPIGMRKMLQVLKKHNASNKYISSVGIGGINHSNAAKVLFQCRVSEQGLEGVAIVSCIMAADDAAKATRDLVRIVAEPAEWTKTESRDATSTLLSDKIRSVTRSKPLVHHITNNVVKNFSANVTLAIGASPAMSELPQEYEEFAQVPHVALVANVGTPTPELLEVFKAGILAYNKFGKPIVYDPVAAGASKARLEASRSLLNTGHVSVIKGNLGEISTIYKLTSTYKEDNNREVLMRGVDSVAVVEEEKILTIGRAVSFDFKTIVVITGATNYVFEDDRVAIIAGGHELMGSITGTGCSLGSVIASFLAAKADGTNQEKFNYFDAVIGAVKLYNECGAKAGAISRSPGTFMINFIDQLYIETHK